MSNGHVRRAETPKSGKAHRFLGRIWLLFFALPIVVIIPQVLHVIISQPKDEIGTVIKQAGFDPIVPPTRLRGPGALYEVEDGFFVKVCGDTVLADSKVQKSPTLDRARRRLENSGFSLAGDYIDVLNAKLTGARLTSVQFTLTDVAVSEITEQDLFEIQDTLLQQKYCEKAVDRLLKENIKVCSGSAALSATTAYKVHTVSKFDSGAQDKGPVAEAIRKAIQEETGGEIQTQGDDEFTGVNLFFGIRLTKSCITPDTATEPSLLPQQPMVQ